MNQQHVLVAVISMDSKSLEKLLLSINKSQVANKIKMNFIVFMNNKNYKKPKLEKFENVITYLPLPTDEYLNIALARTFLQQKVFEYCKEKSIYPVVWFLDEDIEIDKRVNDYLPTIHKLRDMYDVIIGSIEGDSPNASFSGINVQLLDLIHNLNYLRSLDDNDLFPNHEKHNQLLREKYPDYYYDLSSRHSNHFEEYFYITPIHDQESVREVKDRIYSKLDNIISGQNLFRPIVQENKLLFSDSLLRGGNTFVLNLDTLKIKNPSIKIKDYTIRRSDMLWALINKKFLRKKIVKTNFTVIHNRQFDIQELNLQKTVEENSGSIIFNALRIYLEQKKQINFEKILNEQVTTKKEAVEKNFKMILNNINTLKNLKNPKLKIFIDRLEQFYNSETINNIINRIEEIKDHKKNILNQFISYKPLIIGSCTLETIDCNFIQYDIGNEDIKIITKVPIEDINKCEPIIRIHSSCCNSEVFGATDCDCASQLKESMNVLSTIDNGILFYLTQEGRGHGYGNKIAIVEKMQTKQIDTYKACTLLDLEDDIRDYTEVAIILKKLDIHNVQIASNNPRKIEHLKKHGIEVKTINNKLITLYTHENIDYLMSKEVKGKHKALMLDEKTLIQKYPSSINCIEFYEKFDDYGGFSNFSDYPFYLQDRYWRTSEHYYQACKFKRSSEIFDFIQQSKTATEAKNLAYSVDMHYGNWDNKKILFMLNALFAKFRQNKSLKQELLDTHDSYIVEKATDDEYWGSGVDGNGKNILGRLLMYVRTELKR